MRPAHLNHRVAADCFTQAEPGIRALVRERTENLAIMAGRAPNEVSTDDRAQARRELTGESDTSLQDAIIDAPAEPEPPNAERRLAASRPTLSRRDLRLRVESFRAADVGAIEFERNRLPYRRLFP